METVIMTTDESSSVTAPEKDRDNRLFAHTQSTTGLFALKGEIRDSIATGAIAGTFSGVIGSGIVLGASMEDLSTFPAIATLVIGAVLSLGGVAAPTHSILKIAKLKKRQKKAVPQATSEVSSWLKEIYELKVSDAVALEVAEYMSIVNKDSRTWGASFEDETGKAYNLRCNPEGLFYIENTDGQKALTDVSESLTENIKSLTAHPSTSAISKTDAQLLADMQTKANSLLACDTSVETKITVQQLTAEALKAVELNEKLTKLNPTANSSNLNLILGLLDTELDDALSKEVTQVEREMERQNIYIQSRQQSKNTSKLKLNS